MQWLKTFTEKKCTDWRSLVVRLAGWFKKRALHFFSEFSQNLKKSDCLKLKANMFRKKPGPKLDLNSLYYKIERVVLMLRKIHKSVSLKIS